MDTRITKLRKLAAFILTAALIILSMMAMSVRITLAAGNEGEEDGDQPGITIEVVEEIPASGGQYAVHGDFLDARSRDNSIYGFPDLGHETEKESQKDARGSRR